MYLPQNERKQWDGIVNTFLHCLLGPNTPVPSKAGLTYALSRIIWAVFNKYPSFTVGSDLRAILTDVRDEFTRRKLWSKMRRQMIDNGDLPEGESEAYTAGKKTESPSPDPDIGGHSPSAENINIQQLPKLPKGAKFVTLSDVEKCIAAGLPLSTLLESDSPAFGELGVGGGLSTAQPFPLPGLSIPNKTTPLNELPPLIKDPAYEDSAAQKVLLALKAFAIAKQSKAKETVLHKLTSSVSTAVTEYLKVLGVE